jgi:hypothetical protein
MTTSTATQAELFDPALVIRPATAADDRTLARLAALDSARPLRGEALVAFVGDEPWAALSLADRRVVADPFRPSATAAELLRVRARHLHTAHGDARRAVLSRPGLLRRA